MSSTSSTAGEWKKPSLCTATESCVEVSFKSACSNTGQCVEVMDSGTEVHVRNSKDVAEVVFTYDEWTAFIEAVRSGEFDPRKKS
jgi:Domain of unknown function (DUF397)